MNFLKNPRVYIYLASILFCVSYLKFAHRLTGRTQPGGRASEIPIARQKFAPVPGNSQLSTGKALPRFYLFGTEEQLFFAENLRSSLKGRCSILKITVTTPDMNQYFGLKELPLAVLYDRHNQELFRSSSPWTEEDLFTKADAVLPKAVLKADDDSETLSSPRR